MNIHDLELKISKLLRIGVLTAAVVIAVGWLWGIAVHSSNLFLFAEYHSESLAESVRSYWLAGNAPVLVTYLGLAILVSLPAVRVLLTGILFLIRKETILGWIALAVFSVLVTSFLLGTSL